MQQGMKTLAEDAAPNAFNLRSIYILKLIHNRNSSLIQAFGHIDANATDVLNFQVHEFM